MRRIFIAVVAAVVLYEPAPRDTAADHHEAGIGFHLERCLDAAAREYDAALALDPPRPATLAQRTVILQLAPRIFVNVSEPFELKDAAAIVHPEQRLIAYHLLWEDDVDFPDDNDPSDHEVVWVRYGADGRAVQTVALFHGRVVMGAATADDLTDEARPRIEVQWGKHGPLPAGWRQMTIQTEEADRDTGIDDGQSITLLEYNRQTWRKLTSAGTRRHDHPLAVRHGWPSKFDGNFAAFTSFTREVDFRGALDRGGMILISRWNSATLARHLLFYNFRPKLEWPE